jgi:hypothetical protein
MSIGVGTVVRGSPDGGQSPESRSIANRERIRPDVFVADRLSHAFYRYGCGKLPEFDSGSVPGSLFVERVTQDLRTPAGVELFNAHGPYCWDSSGTLRNPCAIGAGGMGEVHRAKNTIFGRHVAIKVLPDSRESEELRIEQEALDFDQQHGRHKIGTTQRTAACRHCTQWGMRGVRAEVYLNEIGATSTFIPTDPCSPSSGTCTAF